MLVLDKIIDVNVPKDYREKSCREIVLECYMGDDVPEAAQRDFKRMVAMCLEHGRFRTIRILGMSFIPLPILKKYLTTFYTFDSYFRQKGQTASLEWAE